MPKKEPVPIVNQAMLSMMDLRQITNNVSDVDYVESDLFGNVLMSKNATNSLGSNSGFRKVIPSEDSLSSPATVISKSNKSKIIGLVSFLNATLISPKSNTSFVTALISGETTALFPS